MRRLNEDSSPFPQREQRLRSPWEPGEATVSRLLRPELVDSAESQESVQSALNKDTAALESSSTVRSAGFIAPSTASLPAREEEQQAPSGHWRESAAQRAPVSLPRRQGYDSGPRERYERSSLDRERSYDSSTAGRIYRDSPAMSSSGKPGENGSLAPRVGRTALSGAPHYGSFRSELVDPILFPPPPGPLQYRQPVQPASPTLAALKEAQEVVAPAPVTVIADPADDRDEFEKELDAVVAELEKVCFRVKIYRISVLCLVVVNQLLLHSVHTCIESCTDGHLNFTPTGAVAQD